MGYLSDVVRCIDQVPSVYIDRLVDTIFRVYGTGKMVLTCGNGGSAATAIHFASDLRSIWVNAWDMLSPAKITQIANDHGPGGIFRRQYSKCRGAIVVAFSCSGSSPNIVELYGVVPKEDMFVLTSKKILNDNRWNEWAPKATFLMVDTEDYEVAEDVHLCICHAVKKAVVERIST